MRVGICQVDGKWPNLALAKIAGFHTAIGDEVERYMPLASYDAVYASKVFSDTPDDLYMGTAKWVTRGGTAYDMTRTLPPWIEKERPDWSLWPTWHWDLGYSTRGCPNHCAFCVVPAKEGPLRVVAEFGDLTTGRPTIDPARQQRDRRSDRALSQVLCRRDGRRRTARLPSGP